MAKEYQVEARTYYSKITLDKDHITNSSMDEIQAIIDDYVADGWQLFSTNATSFGAAMYIYLYFERDAPSS